MNFILYKKYCVHYTHYYEANLPERQSLVSRIIPVSYTHLDVYKRQVVGVYETNTDEENIRLIREENDNAAFEYLIKKYMGIVKKEYTFHILSRCFCTYFRSREIHCNNGMCRTCFNTLAAQAAFFRVNICLLYTSVDIASQMGQANISAPDKLQSLQA